jgi:pilus assembly protein FimV
VRNLTKNIVAVSLLMPFSAYPLGIGEIKLHSALNQKLDAEIALLVSADESVSDIKVRLAPPEKFDEAGVPWSYFLSKIKFKAVTLANGTTVVKLSSHEALREPFLDFLLEVSWPTGSLYREFTVLVDPPATYNQPIMPVIQKPQQIAVNSYAANQPAKKVNRRTNRQKQAVDGQYGPTGRNDYLWKVAKRTNVHNDVSVEQMMLAIYEANPGAFYKPNVNALMAGKTLKIPEKNAILKLSKNQALAAYKQQDNIWRGKGTAKPRQSIADETKIATQLELEAPATDEILETAVSTNKDDLAISRAVDTDAKNALATAGAEGMTLQARIEKLELQLGMMQKMLALKDEQIAVLQNSKAGATDVASPVVESDKDKVKKAEIQTQPKKPESVAVKPVAKPVAVKKAPKKPKLVVQPKPEAESGLDLWTLILGGSGMAILGVLGLMWWRKRQDEEDLDNESMFASATEISLPDSSEEELSIPVEDDFSDYDVGNVGESSFLSAFTPSDFDAFDADETEVDPISEADVYLAYGRYQQAEDLMRQAIKDYPDRDECKLKLLEIFYTHEDKSSFEEYAEELAADGKHEDKGFWAKVTEMGVELSPGSSLFAMGNATLETIDLEQPKSKNEPDQILDDSQGAVEDSSVEDFDLSVFDDNDTAQSAVKVEDKKDADENVLDFDLSVFDLDGAGDDKKTETENALVEEVEVIDFDLNSMALDDTEQEKAKAKTDEASEIESVEFDLGTGLEADEKNAESDELTAESASDIDLESFELSLDDNEDEKITVDSESIEDFDFDFDTPVSSTEPVTVLDTGVSDLTDMDELETKMDLARAYIDMGDTGAAKDIVEEVLEKGNDQQKKSAQEILDQLK